MSFTDGKPFIVTEKDLALAWSGGPRGKYFRCYLCGYKFQAGDTVRWQYTNDVKGAAGNPFVCKECDGPKESIVKRWRAMHEESRGRMWWFCRQ